MNTIQILLGVPGHISEGIASGTMTRNAAGIVRWAVGQPNAGSIVAHLQEVAPKDLANLSSSFSMADVTMIGVQLGMLLYMRQRFDRIEKICEQIASNVLNVIQKQDMLIQMERSSWLKECAQAVEYYSRYRLSQDSEHLRVACNKFIEASANTKLLISSYSSDQIAENIGHVRMMIGIDWRCLVLEQLALRRLGEPLSYCNNVFEKRCEWYNDVLLSLDQIQAPTIRMPTLEMLQQQVRSGNYFQDVAELKSMLSEAKIVLDSQVTLAVLIGNEAAQIQYEKLMLSTSANETICVLAS